MINLLQKDTGKLAEETGIKLDLGQNKIENLIKLATKQFHAI